MTIEQDTRKQRLRALQKFVENVDAAILGEQNRETRTLLLRYKRTAVAQIKQLEGKV